MSGLTRRQAIRLGAISIVSGALSSALYVRQQRQQASLRSDTITGPWPDLTPDAFWLLPNLQDAQMVVPDRAHRPFEMQDPRARAAIHRQRSFTVRTNEERLRGPSFAAQPAPGVRRLVAIGDSVTFGWGVAEDQSWPAQLQAELSLRGHKVELINAGVPAQRLHVMAAWLEKMAPRYGVSGVLFTRRLQLDLPDAPRRYAESVARARQALPQARFMVLMPPVARLDTMSLDEQYNKEEQDLRRAMPDTPVLDLTAAMRAAQGQRGLALARAGDRLQLVRLETGEVLEEDQNPGRDLPESFYQRLEDDDEAREALFFDSGHPDAEGFAALVKTIADQVEQAGWMG